MWNVQQEISVPELGRMLSVCSEYQLLNLEQMVLCRLNFRLLATTSYYFVHHYLSLRMRQANSHCDRQSIRCVCICTGWSRNGSSKFVCVITSSNIDWYSFLDPEATLVVLVLLLVLGISSLKIPKRSATNLSYTFVLIFATDPGADWAAWLPG